MKDDWGEAKNENPNYSLESDRAFELAEALKMEVVLPDDHTLLIDIDNGKQLDQFERNIKRVQEDFKVLDIKIVESTRRKGQHCHIYIRLEETINEYERIILQQFLGSDPVRNYLSLRRIRIDDLHPVLLLEKVRPEGF
jgi:hypothetical protein